MSLIEQILTIGIAILATMLTRFLPFIIFSRPQKTPKFIMQLGNGLPPAILGMLVIYCYKDVLLSTNMISVISFLAGLTTVILHLWRKNMLLSIFGGTLSYILLLHII